MSSANMRIEKDLSSIGRISWTLRVKLLPVDPHKLPGCIFDMHAYLTNYNTVKIIWESLCWKQTIEAERTRDTRACWKFQPTYVFICICRGSKGYLPSRIGVSTAMWGLGTWWGSLERWATEEAPANITPWRLIDIVLRWVKAQAFAVNNQDLGLQAFLWCSRQAATAIVLHWWGRIQQDSCTIRS